jgi:fermentation-respiration switch protein FrsA (DUF1100 family)
LTALFIAGGADKIAPPGQVKQLYRLAGAGSEFLLVDGAAHEPLPFYLDELAGVVGGWLGKERE